MKTYSTIFLLLLFTTQSDIAQIFCIPKTRPPYPDIAERAGLSMSYLIRFDVAGFAPCNIHISALDGLNVEESKMIPLFEPAIDSCLKMISFCKDTANYLLTFKYEIKPPHSINRPFVEILSEKEIRIVIEGRKELSVSGPYRIQPPPDPRIDTVILQSNVEYKSGNGAKSDILVQRFYNVEKDSIVIIRNNHPELESDIIIDAQQVTKQMFLERGPNAIYYFIKYSVHRHVKDCDCSDYF